MKSKTLYFCKNCGNEFSQWYGKCPSCGMFNSMVEQPKTVQTKHPSAPIRSLSGGRAQPITGLTHETELRFPTGMPELDRVLGNGAVKGSLVLIGGAPGIGKSTLMLQICGKLCDCGKVLYVSGEESVHQIKMRAERLEVNRDELYVLSETEMGAVFEAVSQEQPDVLIVDSIQTMYDETQDSAPGSIVQVKTCTMALMQLAKGQGITVFVIGHINKDGAIAGPKVLEHMVDCVLSFEGDEHSSYRILRAEKNRFGATNEIGVFEMAEKGLVEVPNPSEMLLSGRPENTPGTCVTCIMEGNRPVLTEVQALVAPTVTSNPRRTCNGFDFNRGAMLMAILEKRGGMKVSSMDAYLNVIGGLTLNEPGGDLAAVMALASSYTDIPIPDDLAAIGEVGLSGELRMVDQLAMRLSEVKRLGFRTCIVPLQRSGQERAVDGLEVIRVRDIREAMQKILRRER